MILNSLQYKDIAFNTPYASLSMDTLSHNQNYLDIQNKYIKKFNRQKQQTFSFTKNGFFAIFMQLKGKIAVSLGESEAIVAGAKIALSCGQDIVFLNIQKNGELDFSCIDSSLDYIFVSSYIMDTFVQVDLHKIQTLTQAKIISNASATMDLDTSDILLLDGYKLTKQGELGVIIYNDWLEDSYVGDTHLATLCMCLEGLEQQTRNEEVKAIFLAKLQETFQENLFLFIEPNLSLDWVLHIGLKHIKAREIIRTMALDDIHLTNGEGCSLGLMQPSRVIQEMGYSELESRWCLALDFSTTYSSEQIDSFIKLLYKRYKQIKALI